MSIVRRRGSVDVGLTKRRCKSKLRLELRLEVTAVAGFDFYDFYV